MTGVPTLVFLHSAARTGNLVPQGDGVAFFRTEGAFRPSESFEGPIADLLAQLGFRLTSLDLHDSRRAAGSWVWRRIVKRILACIFLCLGSTAMVSADPVRLTSGSIFVAPGGASSFEFSGADFAVGGSGESSPLSGSLLAGPVVFSGAFQVACCSLPLTFGFVRNGDQTLRGFPALVFQTRQQEPIVLGNSPRGINSYEGSFSATGFVLLFDGLGASPPRLTQAVTGSGVVSLLADNVGGGTFLTRGLEFRFAPAEVPPSPTPEPTSLLLVGSGIASVFRLRRRSADSTRQ